MKKLSLALTLICCCLATAAQSTYVRFETSKGNITVMLYDATPRHREMFLKSIRRGVYTNAEFNRVIKGFVSQGGDLDDTILNREKRHPELEAKRLPAEIIPTLYHKNGALGAGRDDNPQKASYSTQIYFVTGKPQTDAQLDAVELKKKINMPVSRRELYKTLGGTPHLDGDYTVFGEITEGMEVADAINRVATNKDDVPLTPVKFTVKVIRKK
jgi:cyclophilin family peptidyl-prolyl cis-trans isomerase